MLGEMNLESSVSTLSDGDNLLYGGHMGMAMMLYQCESLPIQYWS